MFIATVLITNNVNVQIASITKLVSLLVTEQLVSQGCVNWSDTVLVSAEAAAVKGTTAELKAGETYTLMDLAYGMMLPSGNDAATAIAEHVGKFCPAVVEESWLPWGYVLL